MNSRPSDSLKIQIKSREEMNQAYKDIATNNERTAQLLESIDEEIIKANEKSTILKIDLNSKNEKKRIEKDAENDIKKINQPNIPEENEKLRKIKEIKDQKDHDINRIDEETQNNIKSIKEKTQETIDDIPNQEIAIEKAIQNLRLKQNTSSQLNKATGLCELHGDRDTQQDAADAGTLNIDASAWDARSKRSRARALINTVSNLESNLKKKGYDQGCGGSTLNASLIGKRTITTANVGDSAAILVYWDNSSNQLKFKRMGHSHNIENVLAGKDPFYLHEQERIKEYLIRYANEECARMPTGVNMTRSMGDNQVQNKVLEGAKLTSDQTKQKLKAYQHSHEPEISEIDIPNADQVFLINACDGLTDEFDDSEIAYLVYQFVNKNPNAPELKIAVHLAKCAYDRASEKNEKSDNITVLVTNVNQVIGKNKNNAEENFSRSNSTSITESTSSSTSSSASAKNPEPLLLDKENSKKKSESNKTISEQKALHFVAVFDGHGSLAKGHLPAQQLRADFENILQKNLSSELSISLELSTILDTNEAIDSEIQNIRSSEKLDNADKNLLEEVEKNTKELIQAFWSNNQNIDSKNNPLSTAPNYSQKSQKTAKNHGEKASDSSELIDADESDNENKTNQSIIYNKKNNSEKQTNKTIPKNIPQNTDTNKSIIFQNYLNTIKKVEQRNRHWKILKAGLLALAGIALLGLAITVSVASVGGAAPIAMLALPVAGGLFKAAAIGSVMAGGVLGASTLGIFGSEILSKKSPLQIKMSSLSTHARSQHKNHN